VGISIFLWRLPPGELEHNEQGLITGFQLGEAADDIEPVATFLTDRFLPAY
jgi:hypothetical protein